MNEEYKDFETVTVKAEVDEQGNGAFPSNTNIITHDGIPLNDELLKIKKLLDESVIERAEGFIKFPDGTLICYGKVIIQPGVLYTSVVYPKEFISLPTVTVTSGYYNQKEAMAVVGSESKSCCDIYITELTSVISALRGGHWQAIGRWK